MIYAVLILSVFSNVWCLRATTTNVNIEQAEQESQGELARSRRSQAACEWKDAPENAESYRECGHDECEVEPGSSVEPGTVRFTHCEPGFQLIQGNERDVCQNGEWTSRGHECARPIAPSTSGKKGCSSDSQCPDDKRCLGQTCLDLCPRFCGANSVCKMTNHTAVCTCRPGYMGNPYDSCTEELAPSRPNDPKTSPVPECRWLTDSTHLEGSPPAVAGGRSNRDTCINTEYQALGEFTPLNRRDFPYLGVIGDEEFNTSCFGALISEWWFLSSANCCDTCKKKVRLGVYNENNRRGRGRPEFEVTEVHIHPDYEGGDLNDIGLYKLKTEVRFSKYISPACLISSHQPPGTKAVFIGKLNGTLVKSTTEIWAESQCKDSSTSYDDKSMFCAFKFGSVSGLQMYSGLPLVGPLRKSYCKDGLLGLGTFGEKTKSKGYMRISNFLPWIESVVLD